MRPPLHRMEKPKEVWIELIRPSLQLHVNRPATRATQTHLLPFFVVTISSVTTPSSSFTPLIISFHQFPLSANTRYSKKYRKMSGELQLEPLGGRSPRDSVPLLHTHRAVIPSSSEIVEEEDDDVEAGSIAVCRICLECDGEDDDDLISPCMCKGTQQFVHRMCLDHWRSVKEGFAFSHCTTCKAQFHLRVAELGDNSWRKIKFRLFVARDVFLVFLAVQTVVAVIAGSAYLLDKNGTFKNSFNDSWDRVLSRHPIPFYYCIGVLGFFVLVGFLGLILHCCSLTNDPRVAGCQNCCYGWGILDCFPASMEACFVLVIVCVVIFAILGIAYGFLAATMAIQRIWQRHYHILTKKELTQEYVVEDLHGCYSPPKLDLEHEMHLKMLKLL